MAISAVNILNQNTLFLIECTESEFNIFKLKIFHEKLYESMVHTVWNYTMFQYLQNSHFTAEWFQMNHSFSPNNLTDGMH